VSPLRADVQLPVEVRQASAATAMFVVRADAVRRVIDGTGLEPATLPGGRALAIVVAVQYDDNDLGRYDEVGLCFPVRSPATGQPKGAYIHRLPVNGEYTCEVGREVWGFPKWVADIQLSFDTRGARCELRDEGELIVRFDVARRPIPVPARSSRLDAYSALDGVLRRTPFSSRAAGVRVGPGGARVEVGSRHPMAGELRELGLPRRALMSSIIGDLRASFDAPVEVSATIA
jgi:hypothetical protein